MHYNEVFLNAKSINRLRIARPNFIQMRGFIESFAKTTSIVSQVMEILKNRGLDKTSYKECYHLSTKLPRNSKVKKRLQTWLKQNLTIQKQITTLTVKYR